jgi:hypothetical protein
MSQHAAILIEPWMQHFRAQLLQLQSGTVRSIEMRGHVYGLCGDCRKVVKMSGWFNGLHLCVNS